MEVQRSLKFLLEQPVLIMEPVVLTTNHNQTAPLYVTSANSPGITVTVSSTPYFLYIYTSKLSDRFHQHVQTTVLEHLNGQTRHHREAVLSVHEVVLDRLRTLVVEGGRRRRRQRLAGRTWTIAMVLDSTLGDGGVSG